MKGPLTPKHPVPEWVWNQGKHTTKRSYYRIPNDYRAKDEHLDALTEGGSLVGEWVRLVAGRRGGTYSRTPESCITLDGISLGIDHRWSKYLPKRLAEIATRYPGVCAWAWGADGAALMRSPDFLTHYFARAGKLQNGAVEYHFPRGMHHKTEWPLQRPVWDWFVAGWYEIARHPAVLRLWIEGTLDKLRGAFRLCDRWGWEPTDQLVALIARAANSYGVAGVRRQLETYAQDYGHLANDPIKLVRAFYDDPDEYDHSERDDRIMRAFSDSKADLEDVDASALNWDAPVVRFNGTVPNWVGADIALTGWEDDGN